MFYRLIVTVILVFWGWMTIQLLRVEVFSREGRAQPIPVGFVYKLLFQHEQTADLTLFSQGHRLDGALHLQPKRLPAGLDGRETALNLLSGNGSFALDLPGANVQRIVLRGAAEMTDEQQLGRITLTVSLHEAKQSGPGTTLLLDGQPTRDEWHYTVRQGADTVREGSGTLAKLLADADPHLPGLSLDSLAQTQQRQLATTQVLAHRGSLRAGGESIDAYIVSIQQGDSSLATLYFNQLGQILAIKTFAGYDFYDEGVAP